MPEPHWTCDSGESRSGGATQALCPCEANTVFSQRIIFSTPFAVISYFLIWFVPDISRGQVMWYLVFYCIFQTLVTVSWALHAPGLVGEGWRGRIPAFTSLNYTERQVPIPELILLVPLQCFHVPYSALTMFISREQSERDSATAYRKSISFPSSPWPGGSRCSALLLQLSLGHDPPLDALLEGLI